MSVYLARLIGSWIYLWSVTSFCVDSHVDDDVGLKRGVVS